MKLTDEELEMAFTLISFRKKLTKEETKFTTWPPKPENISDESWTKIKAEASNYISAKRMKNNILNADKSIHKEKSRSQIAQEIKTLYETNHLSCQKIAEIYGRSRQSIFKTLKQLGVDTRKGFGTHLTITCHFCEKQSKITRSRAHHQPSIHKFCNQECYTNWLQTSNYNPSRWGQRVSRAVIQPILEQLGWTTDFLCHHKDGNEENFSLKNLIAIPDQKTHTKLHRQVPFASIIADGANFNQIPIHKKLTATTRRG